MIVILKKLLNLSKTAEEHGAQQACNKRELPSLDVDICSSINLS